MTETHFLFDRRLQVYRRSRSRLWQCAARVKGGGRFRKSSGFESLKDALEWAEDWYIGLRGAAKVGALPELVKREPTFRQKAEEYFEQVKLLSIGRRTPRYLDSLRMRLDAHILPFFGKTAISKVNKGVVQSYLVQRTQSTIEKTGKPPARNTLMHEIVHIRQILKFAAADGTIPYVPDLSFDILRKTKVSRRAWFSHKEYERLYTATGRRIEEGGRPGWKSHYEDMHDYVLFQANTGLRPDEAKHVEIRDIEIEYEASIKKEILVIDVRGKTGVGICKSMAGAVLPFKRLRDRRLGELREQYPADNEAELAKKLAHTKLFRKFNREMFNNILDEEDLKHDRDGQVRTAYSLRHTYISMRLMEGANIHALATNCRTSVEMIESHYGAHIKNMLDAASLNVMRPKRVRETEKKKTEAKAENKKKQ